MRNCHESFNHECVLQHILRYHDHTYPNTDATKNEVASKEEDNSMLYL